MNAPNPNLPALQLISGDRPVVVGHRGYCAIAPENTLPSFKLALEAGARLVELDYHHSRDGVPVVIHDATLDRTTDARKRWRVKRIRVSDRTVSEIRTLDAGSWFSPKFAGAQVPLLAEALDFIVGRGGTPVIEHKSGDAETCVSLLRGRNLVNKVVVISFDWSYLRAFHRLEPNQVLGALGPPLRLADGKRPPRSRKRLGATWLGELRKTDAKLVVWNRDVTKEAVQLAHRDGLVVSVYTVDSAAQVRRLLELGVDVIVANDLALIEHIAFYPER